MLSAYLLIKTSLPLIERPTSASLSFFFFAQIPFLLKKKNPNVPQVRKSGSLCYELAGTVLDFL